MHEPFLLFHERRQKKATPGSGPASPREGSKIWRVGIARTRPLAGPLSPRGPQPVVSKLRDSRAKLNGPPEPKI
jgi:hypothetical protein